MPSIFTTVDFILYEKIANKLFNCVEFYFIFFMHLLFPKNRNFTSDLLYIQSVFMRFESQILPMTKVSDMEIGM